MQVGKPSIDKRPRNVTPLPPKNSHFDRRLRVVGYIALAAGAGTVASLFGVGAALGCVAMAALSWAIHRQRPAAGAVPESRDEPHAILERLTLATQAADISAWEFDVASRRFVWDMNRPKAFGLDMVPIADLAAGLIAATHPDDRPLLLDSVRQTLLRGENTYSYRFRLARPGFPIRHMESFARIVTDSRGEPERVLGATW